MGRKDAAKVKVAKAVCANCGNRTTRRDNGRVEGERWCAKCERELSKIGEDS